MCVCVCVCVWGGLQAPLLVPNRLGLALGQDGHVGWKLLRVQPSMPHSALRLNKLTLSLESAIMAPSLNTASTTIRMVGKYLRGGRGTAKATVTWRGAREELNGHGHVCRGEAESLPLLPVELSSAAPPCLPRLAPLLPLPPSLHAHQLKMTVSRPKVKVILKVMATV